MNNFNKFIKILNGVYNESLEELKENNSSLVFDYQTKDKQDLKKFLLFDLFTEGNNINNNNDDMINYFTKDIKEKVKQFCNYKISLEYKLKNFTFFIMVFTNKSNNNITRCKKIIREQLLYALICYKLSCIHNNIENIENKNNINNNRKYFSIYYDIDSKKIFPKISNIENKKRYELFDVNHVNSAFTIPFQYNTNKFYSVIFRREECMKVYIHELIHAFVLDFNLIIYNNINYRSSINNKLENLFGFKIPYFISETITEFLARIMISCFDIFKKQSLFDNKLLEEVNKRIIFEREWSMFQLTNVIYKMGLYDDLKFDNCVPIFEGEITSNYKEKTHIVSYYIITGLLMLNYKDVISWIVRNNRVTINDLKKGTICLGGYLYKDVFDYVNSFIDDNLNEKRLINDFNNIKFFIKGMKKKLDNDKYNSGRMTNPLCFV